MCKAGKNDQKPRDKIIKARKNKDFKVTVIKSFKKRKRCRREVAQNISVFKHSEKE